MGFHHVPFKIKALCVKENNRKPPHEMPVSEKILGVLSLVFVKLGMEYAMLRILYLLAQI